MSSHAQFVARATTAMVKTPRATVRAAASLTGLGKEKNLFIHKSYRYSRQFVLRGDRESDGRDHANDDDDDAHDAGREAHDQEGAEPAADQRADQEHVHRVDDQVAAR